MNYRHSYHAGNFADVFKHWILVQILEKLAEKPAPFCVVDSHAGLGLYDLKSSNAQKTFEYKTGIELFLQQATDPIFASYRNIVSKYFTQQLYPGSPKIIQELLRPEDRLILSELHPEDFQVLQQNFHADRRVKVFQQDAYQTVKAVLPPKERRGLILIDPPFEKTDEFAQIITCLQAALKRFATGIYAVWYPIKDLGTVQKFYRELRELSSKLLIIEMQANTAVSNQLGACAVAIINPSWQLDEKIRSGMPPLLKYLQLEHGSYRLICDT